MKGEFISKAQERRILDRIAHKYFMDMYGHDVSPVMVLTNVLVAVLIIGIVLI